MLIKALLLVSGVTGKVSDVPTALARPELVGVSPLLIVDDLQASIAFYRDALGFGVGFCDDAERPRYAAVRRDQVELHLQGHDESEWQHGGDRPTYRFVVDDPDRLSQELEGLEGVDRTPGSATPWGTREFHVRDPDGNGLQFYRDL